MEGTSKSDDVQDHKDSTQDHEPKSTDSVDAEKPQPTNMQRYYFTRGSSAVQAFNDGKDAECYSIATELLADPRLPLFWRAQCNMLMATTTDPTAVEHAKSAIKWADRGLAEEPDHAQLLVTRRKAQAVLDRKSSTDTAADAATSGK